MNSSNRNFPFTAVSASQADGSREPTGCAGCVPGVAVRLSARWGLLRRGGRIVTWFELSLG